MMVACSLLFLVGTVTLASAHAIVPIVGIGVESTHRPVLPVGLNFREKPVETFIEYARTGSPFIKNFIQKGTNVFYKPQFTLASGPPQPLIVENKDCNDLPLVPLPAPVYPIIDEPIRIIENHLDGEAEHVIEVKPWVPAPVPMPAPMPVSGPVLIEEPAVVPALPSLPPLVMQDEVIEIKPHTVPILPVPMPEPIPVLVEEPEVIPPAPILPPLVMPEPPMPAVVEVEPPVMTVAEPIVPVPLEPAIIEEPEIIPEAPVLPPLTMPEFPVPVVEVVPQVVPELPMMPIPVVPMPVETPEIIPEAPVLPELVMPELPVVEVKEPIMPVPAIIEEPIMISEVPVMPPLVMLEPVPEIIDMPAPKPTIVEEPVVIPEAPLLPPLTMPELPTPMLTEERVIVRDEAPMVISSAPLLPPFEFHPVSQPEPPMVIPVIPEYPAMMTSLAVELPKPAMHFMVPQIPFHSHMPVFRERVEIVDKIVMPAFPSTISFPTSCAQEIVAERVLPNILREQKLLVPATYPVPSPFLYRP